jgi:hypothetical protein
MPIPILDDDAIAARIDEIDQELQNNADVDRDKERQSLEDRIIAYDEYDRNEAAGMSSTDATIDAGRSSQPIDKLKDKIADSGTPKHNDGGEQQEEQQQEDEQQQQSKPEPDAEPETEQPTESESEQTGIRTIPVVQVTVTPGPHATPSGGNVGTNQPRPEVMRTLGRQQYNSLYTNTPSVWHYPGSSHNTDQVGLVRQSYKSYFGMN